MGSKLRDMALCRQLARTEGGAYPSSLSREYTGRRWELMIRLSCRQGIKRFDRTNEPRCFLHERVRDVKMTK
jgi:hypothetical protein